MTEKQIILDALQPLFERAEREGLWFNCSYQDLWFSPNELRKLHKENRFVWGAQNWRLRNPQERLNQFENDERRLNHEKNEFLAKIKNKN
jgi:hypothetical protein